MANLTHIQWTANFDAEVTNFKWVVLVDFYADRCGPCRMLAPIMEELSDDNQWKAVKILKLNVDENQDLASKFGIMSIPAVFAFKDWKPTEGMVWLRDKIFYQDKINTLLA
jgi:thioredoxin 1